MKMPKYKLYAIYTKHLAKDALKGFEYSLVANNRYALVFTDRELTEPYKQIQDGVMLEPNEQAWLTECERKNTKEKIRQNVAHMREHESEYSGLLGDFAITLEKELKAEQEKLKEENNADSTHTD